MIIPRSTLLSRRRSTRSIVAAPLAFLLAALIAAGWLAAVPAVAQAHVRVQAEASTPGSYTVVTFRVPTESASASTTTVSVQLPQDRPFLSVSTQPVSGWTVKTAQATLPKPIDMEGTTITKAVRTVTWTATGAGIRPGEFQQFRLSVGPLPDGGTVVLPATQTYSDGSVVRWDQPSPASGQEPEHPAPQFEVGPAPVPAASEDDPAGSVLGWVSLGVGSLAVLLAAVALVRTRGVGPAARTAGRGGSA